ncbi:MAG: hypothetical protein ABIJ56_15705 [Pseudomonadota bacterium]
MRNKKSIPALFVLTRGLALLWLFAMSCGNGGGESDADSGEADGVDEGEAGEDAVGEPEADMDAIDAGEDADEDAEEAVVPPGLDRALLIDMDLLHHGAWIDVKDALDGAGITLDYRRFYPHIARADIEGEGRYPLIIIAAGQAPGFAASRMSTDEIDEIAGYVTGGGVLLLMPQPTRLDSYYGENDWYIFNRVLEVVESSMRIERGSLLGPLFLGSPDPPHLNNDLGYATLLEFDIGYAWAYPNADSDLASVLEDPIPAGRATVLRTSGSEAAVMLTAHRGSNLWIRTSGETISDQIRSIIDRRPIAAVEKIGDGLLAVVPRFLITLGGAGGQVSEHPAIDTETIGKNALFVNWLFDYLGRLHSGETELVPTDPSGGYDDLFWVKTPSRPPAGEGEVISVAYEPSARTVAPDLPEGELLEEFTAFDPDEDLPAVPIFAGDRGKIGYGGMPWNGDEARAILAETAAMNIDAYVGGFTPERLVTGEMSPEDAEAMRAKMGELGDIAQEEGAQWLVGGYYIHPYAAEPSEFPKSVGAQRQQFDAPPLLFEAMWDDTFIPAAVEVAQAAADHPGIIGYHIDMEMYGTVLTFTDAQAFDDTTFDIYLETITDSELKSLLETQPLDSRLDALIENGVLADFFGVLYDKAVEIGARMREAAHAVDPDLIFTFYFPNFPVCWQYRGLIEGLGDALHPVIILTYDPYSRPSRGNMVACGSSAVHVGGAIMSHFPPENLTDVLNNCTQFTDGFWYFSHNEISATGEGDLPFGTREEYRTAITNAD